MFCFSCFDGSEAILVFFLFENLESKTHLKKHLFFVGFDLAAFLTASIASGF